jgi:RecB family exonuclease
MAFPVSYSRIEAFDCPYRGQQLYVKNRKEPETIPLLRGQLGHQILAEYTDHCVSAGLASDHAAFPGIFRANWEKGKLPGEEMDALKIACANAIEGMIVGPNTRSEMKIAVNAAWQQVDFFKGKDIMLRGVIDRIDVNDDGAGVITDYTFGWGPAAEKALQLKIYAAIANVLFPDVPEWRPRVYNAQNRTERKDFVITTDDLPRIRRDIESDIRRVWTLAEAKKPAAIPGDHCGVCGFSSECPAKDIVVDAIGNREQAEAALAKLIVLDRETSRIKAMLKPFCNASGPVETGGMIIGHLPKSTKVYDKIAVVDAAIDKNLGQWDFFNVNSKATGFKSLGIEPIEIKPGVQFKMKKAGAQEEEE